MSTAHLPSSHLRTRLLGLLPLLALLMAILTLSTHIRLRVMLGDEGVTCVNAWRLAMGQMPGKDFFEIIPPFSFYVLSLLFRVAGPTLIASRALAFVYGCLLPLLLLLLSRRLFTAPVARALPVAFMIPFGVCAWPIPSHHWLVDILQLGAILAWLLALERAPLPWSFCAGALSGLAVMTLQDQGLYWIAAATFLVLPTAPRATRKALALGWCGGGALALTVAAATLLPGAGLQLLVRDWFLLPLTHYQPSQGRFQETGAGWSEVLRSLHGGAFSQSPVLATLALLSYVLVFALPLLAALSVLSLWRSRLFDKRRLAVLLAAALAFVGGALHRWTIMNLVWAAAAPSLLLAAQADNWLESTSKWRRWTAYSFCAAVLGLFFLFGALRSYQVMRGPVYEVSAPAGNIATLYLPEAEAVREYLDAIVRLVPNGTPAFAYGYVPLVGFLTGHPNPTKYTVLLTASGYNSREQGQEWIAEVESGNIQWGFSPRWAVTPEDPVARYLVESFEPAWQNGFFILWRRRFSPKPGSGG